MTVVDNLLGILQVWKCRL